MPPPPPPPPDTRPTRAEAPDTKQTQNRQGRQSRVAIDGGAVKRERRVVCGREFMFNEWSMDDKQFHFESGIKLHLKFKLHQ